MFQVGDKILYPMHGAAIIEAVEEKEVLGKNKLYYILNIPQVKMQVMVPMDNAANLGIRQIVEPEILENVLRGFHLGNTDPSIYENQRYCRDTNKKKIKSGNIYEGTEIIRDLTRKGQRSKLGAEDTNMLNNARQIFVSELMEVKGLAQEQADHLLNEVLELESISNMN
ncbi:MAG TPA: CarD family transcriptional regulator [Candidatus Deferrimicrobium sp.]|nr:CarD family transcriptional regulator [Candidatus Deferrimicrobium sp.]